MEKKGGPRPTHTLALVAKDANERFQTIGAGWVTESGTISLALNKGIIISWRDLSDHSLYLYPQKDSDNRR